MCFQFTLCRALAALGIVLLLSGMPYPVHAQNGCVTFGLARKLGLCWGEGGFISGLPFRGGTCLSVDCGDSQRKRSEY